MAQKKKQKYSAAATNSSGTSSESPMDVTLLERLVRLMSANDLNTIDVRDGEKRVVLKRGAAGALAAPNASPAYYAPAHHAVQPTHSLPGVAAGAAGTPGADMINATNLIPIKSPMVGTFYTAASPDAEPFVSVGSTVDEETDVCIIEAMKVFNNIKAECKGRIARILVQNGETVEFGQALFLVQPG